MSDAQANLLAWSQWKSSEVPPEGLPYEDPEALHDAHLSVCDQLAAAAAYIVEVDHYWKGKTFSEGNPSHVRLLEKRDALDDVLTEI